MDNPNDLCVDSILLDASVPADVYIGPHIVANSIVIADGWSQQQIEEAF